MQHQLHTQHWTRPYNDPLWSAFHAALGNGFGRVTTSLLFVMADFLPLLGVARLAQCCLKLRALFTLRLKRGFAASLYLSNRRHHLALTFRPDMDWTRNKPKTKVERAQKRTQRLMPTQCTPIALSLLLDRALHMEQLTLDAYTHGVCLEEAVWSRVFGALNRLTFLHIRMNTACYHCPQHGVRMGQLLPYLRQCTQLQHLCMEKHADCLDELFGSYQQAAANAQQQRVDACLPRLHTLQLRLLPPRSKHRNFVHAHLHGRRVLGEIVRGAPLLQVLELPLLPATYADEDTHATLLELPPRLHTLRTSDFALTAWPVGVQHSRVQVLSICHTTECGLGLLPTYLPNAFPQLRQLEIICEDRRLSSLHDRWLLPSCEYLAFAHLRELRLRVQPGDSSWVESYGLHSVRPATVNVLRTLDYLCNGAWPQLERLVAGPLAIDQRHGADRTSAEHMEAACTRAKQMRAAVGIRIRICSHSED